MARKAIFATPDIFLAFLHLHSAVARVFAICTHVREAEASVCLRKERAPTLGRELRGRILYRYSTCSEFSPY
jgi:hypothetical protein